MSDQTVGLCVMFALLGLVLGFILGSIAQVETRDNYWRRQAVIEGKAEYWTVNGAPEWRWKP